MTAMVENLRLDHVILAVRDLDAAAATLKARFGLDSHFGGEHPGFGTANRIVPLGDAYLELFGVVDHEAAAGSPVGTWLGLQLQQGEHLLGWCVRSDDVEAVAARLGLIVQAGVRRLPDGSDVHWRSAGMDVALAEPWLPFFITWQDMAQHPARSRDVRHEIEVRGVRWVELGAAPRDRLREWLGGAELPVRFGADNPGVSSIAIATDGQDLVIGGHDPLRR